MHQGTLVARCLVGGAKFSRPVAVRLSWVLLYTDLKNIKQGKDGRLPDDLGAWRKPNPQKIPLERGKIKPSDEPESTDSHKIKLEYTTRKGPSTLELDFESQGQIFQEWHEALYLMLTPWETLLKERRGDPISEHRNLLGRIATLEQGASDAAEKAEKWKQCLNENIERLANHIQRDANFSKVLEAIMKAFEISEGPVKEVLGKLPLVGAGFQALAFGMSCTAHIIALKANEKLELEIRQTMAWIAGLTVTELLRASGREEVGQ